MPENENPTPVDTVEPGAQPDPAPPAQEDTEPPKAERVEDLPEWAQRLVGDLRTESASRRTAVKELEGKLAEAKTPEEHKAAVDALALANADLERRLLINQVARTHNLPDALASRLQGNSKEELEADAKALAAFAARPQINFGASGGLSPEQGAPIMEFDPRKQAARFRRRR